MNKIIPAFSSDRNDAFNELEQKLIATNTGAFIGLRASYNNRPLLISDEQDAPFGETLNHVELLRRIFIQAFVNKSDPNDVPTHILIAANLSEQRREYTDEETQEMKEIIHSFESHDFPVPTFVYGFLHDSLFDTAKTLLDVAPVVVEPIPTPVTESKPEPVVVTKPVETKPDVKPKQTKQHKVTTKK